MTAPAIEVRLSEQSFDGEQGDIFLNLVSKNFNGDIDVFMLDGLRPLTKMVIYSDLSENETGRVIYLRKPEKLLLLGSLRGSLGIFQRGLHDEQPND